MPAPTITDSAMGESFTRSSPNSSMQTLGDPIRASIGADILAQEEHTLVVLTQRLPERAPEWPLDT